MTPARAARTIDIAALRSRIEEDPPRILDVHTPAEFETAHIPGSCNVPLGLLREHRDELARPHPPGRPAVAGTRTPVTC